MSRTCLRRWEDTLRKFEHVLEPVNDLQAALLGELADIPRVEEAFIVCTTSLLDFSIFSSSNRWQ